MASNINCSPHATWADRSRFSCEFSAAPQDDQLPSTNSQLSLRLICQIELIPWEMRSVWRCICRPEPVCSVFTFICYLYIMQGCQKKETILWFSYVHLYIISTRILILCILITGGTQDSLWETSAVIHYGLISAHLPSQKAFNKKKSSSESASY